MKKITLIILVLVFFAVCSGLSQALSIGISPGRAVFQNVLRGGYSERTITISTSSDEKLIASYRVEGDIKGWIGFDTNSTEFNISGNTPYKLKIIAQPPIDVRTGNYTGRIEFITEGIGDISGRAGSVIKTEVTLLVNLEVTGDQIIKCRGGAFNINDLEIGFPVEISSNVINDGNVRLKPTITLDVYDQAQENLVFTKELFGQEVFPTTQKTITASTKATLGIGQYWANVRIKECGTENLQTFSVLEKGGIADKGDFVDIYTKPWIYTNETSQLIAKFQNTGSRSVTAKLKGVIRNENQIVQIVDTEELLVPSGGSADFDVFFTPEVPGRYTFSGRVLYNNKLTFEKGAVINVNPAPEQALAKKIKWIPLIIYVIIISTILFFIRKILKEKRKRRF
ncbi:MAG TPA: hypothetical protein VI564_00705 [Candidatus Nanoarchaeia archaeon]|nr:hypothetical protein [Candidatus Nanoarchaeia archaeon]